MLQCRVGYATSQSRFQRIPYWTDECHDCFSQRHTPQERYSFRIVSTSSWIRVDVFGRRVSTMIRLGKTQGRTPRRGEDEANEHPNVVCVLVKLGKIAGANNWYWPISEWIKWVVRMQTYCCQFTNIRKYGYIDAYVNSDLLVDQTSSKRNSVWIYSMHQHRLADYSSHGFLVSYGYCLLQEYLFLLSW